jgi:hypothetical protein
LGDDLRVDGKRQTRWERAKADRPKVGVRRELASLFVGGAVSVLVLLIAGFNHDAGITAITIGGSAIAAAVIVPASELAWAWLQAPMRALTDDVLSIRQLLEANPLTAEAPTVRLWLLNHKRKGEAILNRQAPATTDADNWADVAAEYLMENVDEAAAERFLQAHAIRGEDKVRSLLNQQILVLHLTIQDIDAS